MAAYSRRILLVLLALGVVLAGGLALRARRAAPGAGLTLYGNVDIREVQAAFNDSGQVARMMVTEGARVQRGQLIATLDDTRYAAALAQAEGQMENQKQVLAALLAGTRPEQIQQAWAQMEAARAVYLNNGVTWNRLAQLATASAATIQQRDDARAAYDSARMQYEATRQAYLLAVKGPRAEDIAAARGALQAAQGAVALAQRELADTSLHAPADGVIEDRILEPGDMASPSTPVYTIALPSPLWVRAYAPEADLGRVRLGVTAMVSTDSYPGHVYRGWIGYLSPTAEFTPKSVETPELRAALVYQLRVYVCDPRGELRLGMPATVRIDATRAPGPAPAGCGPDHAAGG